MSPALRSEVVSINEVPFHDIQMNGQGSPSVLVVDDEQLVADTLSLILRRAGFSVRVAYDGPTAMRMAAETAPCLLISDIAMPGMNGLELARTLTALCPQCRVLFFSGHVTSLQLVEMGVNHPYELLTKPVHPTDMLTHVSRLLRAAPAAEYAAVPTELLLSA